MTKITHEEALNETVKYFEGEELPATTVVDKYLLRDNDGNLLEKSPVDMHRRLAKEFHRIEKSKFKNPLTEDQIFNLFDKFKYIIPQGSPMYGIGNDYQTISLSNCYLVDTPEDSYADILRVDEQLVQISKRRGGVGIDISKIRPVGTVTHNASKTSTGLIPFMDRYSNSIREVGQSGRRGALIITLSVHHPEIVNFIHAKENKTKVTGANISVRLSKEFLDAVNKNENYELRWPVDARENGKEPKISKMVSAKAIWKDIVNSAYHNAEPGLLFWDNVLDFTPSSVYEEYKPQGTNPCSELILSPLDSCRLLLLNLYSYVNNPFTKEAKFDFNLFAEHSKIAQRLMDDLVDLESEKVKKIIKKIKADPEESNIKCRELEMWERILKYCEEGRRTGTGITGLGDTMAALGIQYASDECIRKSEKIFKLFKLSAYRSSVDMAKEIGPFKCFDWEREKKSIFIQRMKDEDLDLYNDMRKYGRRNIALLTIAPGGTVSLLTGTTSGLEPAYSMIYTRRKKITEGSKGTVKFIDECGDKWDEFHVTHPKLITWMKVTGESDVTKSPYANSCAPNINWENRVKLQSTIQRHICHSIASTVNLPKEATVEDVEKVYTTAAKSGCKGITVYREGSRDGVLIHKSKESKETKETNVFKNKAPKRPVELPCDIYHIKVTKKLDKVRTFDYLVMIGLYNDSPYEIFAVENGKYDKAIEKGRIIKESKGRYHLICQDGTEIKDITKDTTEHEDALTRMTSTTLRHGVPIEFVVDQLSKVSGDLFSFAKSMARALKKYIKEGTSSGSLCEVCKSHLVFENGCYICKSCGASRCN